MPSTTFHPMASTRQLAELSAVMRAIARSHPESAPVLRLMADGYELSAAASELAKPRP